MGVLCGAQFRGEGGGEGLVQEKFQIFELIFYPLVVDDPHVGEYNHIGLNKSAEIKFSPEHFFGTFTK